MERIKILKDWGNDCKHSVSMKQLECVFPIFLLHLTTFFGAKTFGITTLSVMTFRIIMRNVTPSIKTLRRVAEHCYAENRL